MPFAVFGFLPQVLTFLATTLMLGALLSQGDGTTGCMCLTIHRLPCFYNCRGNAKPEGIFNKDLEAPKDNVPNELLGNVNTSNSSAPEMTMDVAKNRRAPEKQKLHLNEAILRTEKVSAFDKNSFVDIKSNSSRSGKAPVSKLRLRDDSALIGLLGDAPVSPGFRWKAEKSILSCNSEQPVLLVLIHSSRDNFGRRNVIRNTWGAVKVYRSWTITCVFLIGAQLPSEDTSISRYLENEHNLEGDLAMKSTFIDSYSNMSSKHIASYQWASTFCPSASYVIKTDDDVIIDVFKLIDWIVANVKGDTNTYYCRLLAHQEPHRNPQDKWHVSFKDFPRRKFPKFCSGGAYSTTMNVIKLVYGAINHVPPLWLDDVYITGLGAEFVNKILKTHNHSDALIAHKDRSEEYIYYHWERKTGMTLIRDWCSSSINFSPWTFLLVEHGKNYYNDWNMVWKKICTVHNKGTHRNALKGKPMG